MCARALICAGVCVRVSLRGRGRGLENVLGRACGCVLLDEIQQVSGVLLRLDPNSHFVRNEVPAKRVSETKKCMS